MLAATGWGVTSVDLGWSVSEPLPLPTRLAPGESTSTVLNLGETTPGTYSVRGGFITDPADTKPTLTPTVTVRVTRLEEVERRAYVNRFLALGAALGLLCMMVASGCSATPTLHPLVQIHRLDATPDISLNVVATQLAYRSGHEWNLDATINTTKTFTFTTMPFRALPASWILERIRANQKAQGNMIQMSRFRYRNWQPSIVSAQVLDASGKVLWDSRVIGVIGMSPNQAELQPQTGDYKQWAERPDIVLPAGAARIVVTTNRFYETASPSVVRQPLRVSLSLPRN
jgi:hypothetical protein